MINIEIKLNIQRMHEPSDEEAFVAFLWGNDFNLSDRSDEAKSLKLDQFIELLRIVQFEEGDYINVTIARRLF